MIWFDHSWRQTPHENIPAELKSYELHKYDLVRNSSGVSDSQIPGLKALRCFLKGWIRIICLTHPLGVLRFYWKLNTDGSAQKLVSYELKIGHELCITLQVWEEKRRNRYVMRDPNCHVYSKKEALIILSLIHHILENLFKKLAHLSYRLRRFNLQLFSSFEISRWERNKL